MVTNLKPQLIQIIADSHRQIQISLVPLWHANAQLCREQSVKLIASRPLIGHAKTLRLAQCRLEVCHLFADARLHVQARNGFLRAGLMENGPTAQQKEILSAKTDLRRHRI